MNYRDQIITIIAVVAFVIIGLGFSAFQESRVFNRLTGADTTVWDAMFVELRVVEPVIVD